jgi:hypothetical protein
MDMVRDFEAAFKAIKDNPVKDITTLIAVLKKHSTTPDNPVSWRWDVMRSVVSDDLEYVKLVIAAELESIYVGVKSDIEEEPLVLKVSSMLLHTHIKQYKSLVDVVAIQKRIFGEAMFSSIETATISFIGKIYTDLLTKNILDGMTPLKFAQVMYSSYEHEYNDTYYWPHIKATMDKVITNLN